MHSYAPPRENTRCNFSQCPNSFQSWRNSFRVLGVVLLTLKACRPGCLDSYEEHIRAYDERFPKLWGAIVKADDPMRSDGWARERQHILSQLARGRPSAQLQITTPRGRGST